MDMDVVMVNPIHEENAEAENYRDAFQWFASNVKTKPKGRGMISTVFQCRTDMATHLCIQAPVSKLVCKNRKDYSIGGTYNICGNDLWFFFRTSSDHEDNYLMELYAVAYKDMQVTLRLPSISNNFTGQIQMNEADKHSEITGHIENVELTCSRNKIALIKTYSFAKADLKILEHYPLLLPCSININKSYVDRTSGRHKALDTVMLNRDLFKTKSEGDFTIESKTGTKHNVHMFVAATRSPVLNKIIMENKNTICVDAEDEYIEILIDLIYTGEIIELMIPKLFKMMELTAFLEFQDLLFFLQIITGFKINKDNALEILMLAMRYKQKKLSIKVFDFIKSNRDILTRDCIKKINDPQLLRALIILISHRECHCR